MKKSLLSLIAGFTALTVMNGQADPATLTKVGDKAPLFTCKTLDGKTIDISKLQGKIIMINFFATWCPPCNLELPVLQKNIWNKYKDNKDFVLVILGREQDEKVVGDFVAAKKFTMPFAPDPERKVFSLYATQTIPRNVIIGKDGRIIYQNSGYTQEEFRKIEQLLAGKLK
jgi:peroxiredoxin